MTNDTVDDLAESQMNEMIGSHIELYVVMGILSFLSIVGVAGNALVLYVFAQKKDRMTSTLFILGLAFVDFMTCLVVIPYTIYMEFVNFSIQYDVLCKVYQFLITSNIPFSALIMVAIAIDRYFCICHPFLHAINITRARIMIVCLALFAAGLGIITALMYGVYDLPAHDHIYHHIANTSTMENSGTPIPPYSLNTDSGENPVVDGVMNHSVRKIYHNFPKLQKPVFTGHCAPNTVYLSEEFRWYYQKFYTSMFLVSLIIVIILYIAIYKSVLARRTKRQKQKSKSLPMVVSSEPNNGIHGQEETLLTSVNGEPSNVRNGTSPSTSTTTLQVSTTGGASGLMTTLTTTLTAKKDKKDKKDKDRRKSTKKDRTRVANLKTAVMLFVVTVVFIVTFLPAFLMALQLLPYDIIIFYMYFANNVANPVIYSFMNKNFRDDLKKLFCGGR